MQHASGYPLVKDAAIVKSWHFSKHTTQLWRFDGEGMKDISCNLYRFFLNSSSVFHILAVLYNWQVFGVKHICQDWKEVSGVRRMRRRVFRGYRRPVFRPIGRPVFRPIRPWRRFGCGGRGMGCLLCLLSGAVVIFVLAWLPRLII